jgi:hypothetical protein
LLDAFPVEAALAFIGCGFRGDGTRDAGINRRTIHSPFGFQFYRITAL